MTADTAELEPRIIEILASIKSIFASKGFDGASMQDLARAAGMSAGNFYRYFPSKDAIVEAIVERELDQVRVEFEALISSPQPLEALSALAQRRFEKNDDCASQIWAEIEAAASRRPEFAVILGRMEAEVMRCLVLVFARVTGLSEATASRRFSAHARLIILLVKGMSLRAATTDPGHSGHPDPELAALVGATIQRTLTEIAASTRALGAEPAGSP